MTMKYVSSELAVEIFALFNRRHNLPTLKSDKKLTYPYFERELFSYDQCDISYILEKNLIVLFTTLIKSVTNNSHIKIYLVDLLTGMSIVILQI